MGMFDYVWHKGIQYQSKDTPSQGLDKYEVKDGGLWREMYDSEWVDDDEGMFGGYMKRTNKHWVRLNDFDGVIDFYRTLDKTYKTWEEIHAVFVDGNLVKFVSKVVER